MRSPRLVPMVLGNENSAQEEGVTRRSAWRRRGYRSRVGPHRPTPSARASIVRIGRGGGEKAAGMAQ